MFSRCRAILLLQLLPVPQFYQTENWYITCLRFIMAIRSTRKDRWCSATGAAICQTLSVLQVTWKRKLSVCATFGVELSRVSTKSASRAKNERSGSLSKISEFPDSKQGVNLRIFPSVQRTI